MGFWEALFAAGVLVGALLFAFARYLPRRAIGCLLLCGGAAAFGVRALQAGPYAAPRGFDLVVALLAFALAGALISRRMRSEGGPGIVGRLALALAPLALIGTAIATLHETGEIVTLRTTGADGTVRETRLAVLDYDDATWVGAGSGTERRWYRELAASPEVELVRGGVSHCRIATPVEDPEVSEEVLRRLERKYVAGRLTAALGSHLFLNPEAIAVRLDPCAE